jgi:hypothetical protein
MVRRKNTLTFLLMFILFSFLLVSYHGTVKTTHPVNSADAISIYDLESELLLKDDNDKKYIFTLFFSTLLVIILIQLLLLFHQLPVWYFAKKNKILNPIFYQSNFLIQSL